MHQTHQVVFLLFDGHLTAIFHATKLPQFLVLPISQFICKWFKAQKVDSHEQYQITANSKTKENPVNKVQQSRPIKIVCSNTNLCAIKSVAWNIGGLGDKLEALDLQHYLINFDVIILSETW